MNVAQSCPILCDSMDCSPWNSSGQNTGVGTCSLLQGIFPTQESNPGLPHCRQVVYQLSCKGSPKILEWVAYPFSSRSSQPRRWTGISCITGRFLNDWAIRNAKTLFSISSGSFKEIKRGLHFPLSESEYQGTYWPSRFQLKSPLMN